jgi:hypothetical protein
MHKRMKAALLVISFAAFIAFLSAITSLFSIDPRGEQIPMYALIFRGYEIEGKLAIYPPWEDYDWSLYKPVEYNEKYSRKYEERIYIASFYYKEEQKAKQAFEEYVAMLVSRGFKKSDFDARVNNTEKFELIDSIAFEDNDFIYSEFIETKEDYLPGYYIVIIKSNIEEKQLVKSIVE